MADSLRKLLDRYGRNRDSKRFLAGLRRALKSKRFLPAHTFDDDEDLDYVADECHALLDESLDRLEAGAYKESRRLAERAKRLFMMNLDLEHYGFRLLWDYCLVLEQRVYRPSNAFSGTAKCLTALGLGYRAEPISGGIRRHQKRIAALRAKQTFSQMSDPNQYSGAAVAAP